MKNTEKLDKWAPLISGIISIVIGVVIFALTIVDCVNNGLDTEKFAAGIGIAYTFAIGLFLAGILHSIVAITSDHKNLFSQSFILAVASIAIGLFLILNAADMSKLLVSILACLMLIAGFLCLVKAIFKIIYKDKVGDIIFAFIIAVIGIVFGILTIIEPTKKVMGIIIFFVIALMVMVLGVISVIKTIKKVDKPELND